MAHRYAKRTLSATRKMNGKVYRYVPTPLSWRDQTDLELKLRGKGYLVRIIKDANQQEHTYVYKPKVRR